ncbi:MAG: N-acetylneuraminate synthase family protein [Alphaproteobacteria bacterium]
MKIGDRDTNVRVYVIAEIGGNHNGDPETAFRLVEAAAEAGVDAVKFQTYRAESLVHPSVEPVPLVRRFYATQLERFKSLELPWSAYERIVARCRELAVDFLTTPFDLDLLARFAPLMPAVKIASGDLTYRALVEAAAATGKPVLLSTGMATLQEVGDALALVPEGRRAALHCVSIYPLPDEDANLRAIPTLAAAFPDVTIGYSDHTVGMEAAAASVALGARIVEKHFTLDTRQQPGDHVLSLDPAGMAELVRRIRRVEAMLGSGEKRPAAGEGTMRAQMRRGLYAARDLPAGTVLSESDVLCLRPATDLAPAEAGLVVGRRLARPLKALDAIRRETLT